MKKLSVTYRAPKGDSKIVEIWGHTFYDGKAEEVTVDDDVHDTMVKNRFFECGKATNLTDEQVQEERDKAANPQPDRGDHKDHKETHKGR